LAPATIIPQFTTALKFDIYTVWAYNLVMEIKTATDWQQVYSALRSELNDIGYNPDLNRMLNNITLMVTELSKAEVEARRLHSAKNLIEPIEKINKAILHLEQFLLIARLMK